MPESAGLLFLPINLSHCSILFSSSQHGLTPAIPTVDHILSTADQVFYIYMKEK